ncbi:3'-5' exonuclease [Streptomyces griseorubiginosus]|uniref:DNA polymerase III subunit epsilon n=1 Tax=Streptomyces griseorubiginosus TaxID=67304 RepID=A0A117QXF7_9ACTN|nr:3'-5' exonuclease [Streptomyces griseorubiginosus]KUN59249.1 DNA polymerase III subunit epsilon [Streptomyces griseorubiginosus]
MLSPDLTPSLGHLFTRTIDTRAVCFVRPGDTDRPTWALYEDARYLGTVHAQFDSGRNWHVQTLREQHTHLDDAVRALRRPASWRTEHERVRRWVHGILADPRLVVLDVQTTALTEPWAVQIGVTDRHGTVLFNEHLNPLADIAPAATALHGITRQQVADAPSFAAIAHHLGQLLHHRRCLIYNAAFDHGVLERELRRYFRSTAHARAWLGQCTWVDAMRPYAAWKGLWSARRHSYRFQPLGGSYEAVTNCRLLLSTLDQVR